MNWAAILWLVLMVMFLLLEAGTVAVVSLWFAAGSLAAMIVSFLGGAFWLQVAVFLATAGVLLAALRPLVRKYFTPKLTKTNVDSVIGSTGLVTVAIDNVSAVGQVKLDRVEGVKVFVSPAIVPANV